MLNITSSRLGRGLAAAFIATALTATPALAEKPEWAGGGKGNGKQEQREPGRKDRDADYGKREDRRDRDDRHDRRGDDRPRTQSGVSVDIRFGDRHRTVIHDYYRQEYSRGHCPPGLAKKGNGCMPPGQAKAWKRGYPLPREVVYYDLPPRLIIELGAPPAGHRYVRVAADILLIAVGTGMVIDAIEDLSRL